MVKAYRPLLMNNTEGPQYKEIQEYWKLDISEAKLIHINEWNTFFDIKNKLHCYPESTNNVLL